MPLKDLPINKSTNLQRYSNQNSWAACSDLLQKPGRYFYWIYKDGQISWYSESSGYASLEEGRHEDKRNQNYRPVSTFYNLSKVFKKRIYSGINTYMSDKFSKYLTGFRKNHNTQHAFLNMIENWRSRVNKRNKIVAIFMDLSQPFDTLDHSLLIAKLEAYGFDSLSLEFLKNYLINRKQRCKVGNRFSIWKKNYIRCPARFHTYLHKWYIFIC